MLLYEPKTQEIVDQIWAELDGQFPPTDADLDLNAMISKFSKDWLADEKTFQEESQNAQSHLDHWQQYARMFLATYHRKPVLYDLYCGGGGFGRGAWRAGFHVIGVDSQPRPISFGSEAVERSPSNKFVRLPLQGMDYVQADLHDDAFWSKLTVEGCLHGYPPPDVMHASPPCPAHSRLRHLPAGQTPPPSRVAYIHDMLTNYQEVLRIRYQRCVPFSIENVDGVQQEAKQLGRPISMLCGTMLV